MFGHQMMNLFNFVESLNLTYTNDNKTWIQRTVKQTQWMYYINKSITAKGHRMPLMDEPPQKRSKGLVSYDGGDSDDDEDIIRSPQAHTHFQPNSPQLPVIFQRSPQSPSAQHNSLEKLEYAFPLASGPVLGHPPQQRNQVITTEERISISAEQPQRIPISVTQGVTISPPQGDRIAVAHGIPLSTAQKSSLSAQQSLLGERPHQQPFWMSPH